MKIYYIPAKKTKKDVKIYSSTATALLSFLPVISFDSALSFFVIFTVLVLSAYLIYILGSMFMPEKITLEEKMKQHEFNKKVKKYQEDLRGPQPINNAKPKNLL